MNSFAQFRLPHARSYTRIEQTSGLPMPLRSCAELNGHQGFVVAPFHITDEQPILLIRPDRVSRHEVDASCCQPSVAVSMEEHREEYAADFADFHAQLLADKFRKIVLSRCATVQTAACVDPQQLFLQACQLYPRMFIALVSLPDGSCWLTATPEILLEGVGEQWRTIALAGTMQLQGDALSFDALPSEEGKGTVDIRWSTKNIQEQRYVATYIAECLEQFGIEYREEGPRTVRAANLVHLRSDFTFTLFYHARIGDLLEALHPTPAVCGLPKHETFQFIVQNEQTPRQYYSGFMGPLLLPDSGEGEVSTHLYVSLRCMQMRQKEYRLYAGGGLLKDSQLEQEWQETEAKMKTMKRVVNVNVNVNVDGNF